MKTAIILVNYNSYSDTIECLETVLLQTDELYNVFIIDNSNDRTKLLYFIHQVNNLLLKIKLFKHENIFNYSLNEESFLSCDKSYKVQLISSPNNGFAAANNIILRYILANKEYKYIWLLNNDTLLQKNTFGDLKRDFLKKSQKIKLGMLGCVLVYANNPDFVQGVGGLYYKFLGTTKHVLEGSYLKEYSAKKKYHIDYPIGASIFISREFLRDVGLLEESYFLYFEELDWAYRGMKKKWVCDYAEDVIIFHKAGVSIKGKNRFNKRSSDLADFYFYRNRLKFTLNNEPFFTPFVIITVLLSVIYRILNFRASFLKLFLNHR